MFGLFGKKKTSLNKVKHDEKIQLALEKGLVTIKDLIAPPSIELRADHIVIGSKYYRTMFVFAYPRYVHTNWMAPLINFNANIFISLYYYPIESKQVMDELKVKIGQMEATWQINAEKGNVRDPELETQLKDAHTLRDAIQRGEERFFHFGLYITVMADSLQELDQICNKVETTLGGMLIYTRNCTLRMDKGFQTTLPLNSDLLQITRNMDTSALSSTFPFTSSDLTTGDGILYGLNRHNNSLIIFDRFKLENANSVVFAKSGAGKSYAVKLEALRYLMIGTEVIIIDPEREYRALCDAVGGAYIQISLNASTKINPFDLPKTDYKATDATETFRSKIIALLGLLRVLLGELTNKEDAILDKAILETYRQKGITNDPATHSIEPPLMGDLFNVLRTIPGSEGITDRLEKFVTGTFSGMFNQPTNIDINKPFIVFDIRDLEDILRPMGMYLILDFIWNKVRSIRRRRLLLVDESWIMMQHEDSAKFLFGMAKRARKYWLGLTTITQDVEDFLDSPYGRAIVTNSSMQLLLKQSTAAIDKVAKVFNLTEGEKYLLLECDKGEGLFFAGPNHVAIRVIASYIEDQIITSDPRELAKREGYKDEEEQAQQKTELKSEDVS